MFDSSDSMYLTSKKRSVAGLGDRSRSEDNFPANSVMTAVDSFFKSVDVMNQTIMVPSRLMDLAVTTNDNETIPEILKSEKDLFSVYGLLNTTKNSLVYGPNTDDDSDTAAARKTRVRHDTCIDTWAGKTSTDERRESTMSMMSVNSTYSDSATDSDSAEDSNNESSDGSDSAYGVEDFSKVTARKSPENTKNVGATGAQLRSHLIGLQNCLSQLSESANFITELYREDMSS